MKFNIMLYGGVDERDEFSMCTTYDGFDAVRRAYEIMRKEHRNDAPPTYFVNYVESATIRERFDADGNKVYCEYAFFVKSGKHYSWEYFYFNSGHNSGKKWDLVYTVK